jgi:hypothetical protein
MKQLLLCNIVFVLTFTVLGHSLVAVDKLKRKQVYTMSFKISDIQEKRFVLFDTTKALNAKLFLYDGNNKLMMKVSGSAPKKPMPINFSNVGNYAAKVKGYSGQGKFLMFVGTKTEMSKLYKKKS